MAGSDAYESFQEGLRLLASGSPNAAIVALEQARDREPEQASIREALARAYYGTLQLRAAETEFNKVLELDPVNDYAHFGLGLCRLRAGDPDRARGHLRLAVVMRPDRTEYHEALGRALARATGSA